MRFCEQISDVVYCGPPFAFDGTRGGPCENIATCRITVLVLVTVASLGLKSDGWRRRHVARGSIYMCLLGT